MTRRQGIAVSCGLLAAMNLWSISANGAGALSHEHAIEIALASAPLLQAQRAAVESAREKSISAGRLPDPELLMGVDNLPIAGEDAYSFDRDFMTMRKIGVMQSFPNSRKRSVERERAQAVVGFAEQRTHQTQLEVARSTSQAWFAVSTSEALERSLLDLKAELALSAKAARAALASARGSASDALAAQAAISELEDRLLQARAQTRAARAELAQWIGESAAQPLSAAPEIRELPFTREQILSSLHRHAPLRTIDQQLAVARSDVDLARAQKRPDWSAQLAYAQRGDAFSDMVSLEFRVGLPLFARNRQDPVIRAKRADLAQLEAERESELRMHSVEVTRELAAWESARERIELYRRERLPLARERVRASQAAYQSGGIPLGDVLASVVAAIELQRDYTQLANELAQAWAYLRYLEPQEVSP
jgi:cobalt-zinc-cadmium efflux system outer membrane protein